MLSVLKAVKYFRTFLDGRRFVLVSDHSALKELLSTKEPGGRVARWVLKIAELDFEVVHRPPGPTIAHADALSRLPQEESANVLTFLAHESGKLVVSPAQRSSVLTEYH